MKKFRLVVLFIFAAMSMAACGVPIPVLPGEVPLTDAQGFLSWMTDPAGGGWLMVSFFASWIAEYFPGWHKLKSWLRQTIMLVLAALVAAGAQWLLASPEAYAMVEPYLTPVLKFIAIALATQAAHRLDKGSNGSTLGKEIALK